MVLLMRSSQPPIMPPVFTATVFMEMCVCLSRNTGGIIRSKNMSKHGTNWIQRAVDWLHKSKQSWEMNIKYEEI